MKATGIVRRIDDLGRIVVPKEIRKTLKIREGDPLEIFTNNEGEIILKKYSPLGNIEEYAKEYTEAINKVTGFTVLVTDKDRIICASGLGKKDFRDISLKKEFEILLEGRKSITFSNDEKTYLNILSDEIFKEAKCGVISPIISEGDIFGSLIMLSNQNKISDSDLKIIQIAVKFFEKQLS